MKSCPSSAPAEFTLRKVAVNIACAYCITDEQVDGDQMWQLGMSPPCTGRLVAQNAEVRLGAGHAASHLKGLTTSS